MARTRPSYAGLTPPWHPGEAFPELGGKAVPNSAAGNPVYAAVRDSLRALGLDAGHFGSDAWNPLGELVQPGARVVLKPNFIRHWNPSPGGSLDSVVTHGSLLRAMADYAFLAAGASGSVVVAEAPQHDCDWSEISRSAGLDELVGHYAESWGRELEVIDLRRETVRYEDAVIVERRELPGDPRGYRLVDLGSRSAFEGSRLDARRFRGADYDAQPTTEHHSDGHHRYLLSETVLGADLVVNLPKLKTHKKTGVTLALKNLVGINGDKNLLPHHCVGPETEGGDEFPGDHVVDRARSMATEVARGLLKRGLGTGLARRVRLLEKWLRGDDFVRAGNWWGNRTTWRMCLDLNRIFYYSDASGEHWDAPAPVRRALTVCDGIVAGEGEGPLSPDDRPLGVVLAAIDPVALDLAALRLMGFDEHLVPKIWEAISGDGLRVTAVRSAGDVRVFEALDTGIEERGLQELAAAVPFRAHSGWRGHVEATPCAA
jgi:uncharacterized protein (DUF362 family)